MRYLPAKLAPMALTFAGLQLFTRLVTTEAFGRFNLVLAVVTPAVAMLTEWAAQPLGRFYSEYVEHGRVATYRRAAETLAGLVLTLSLVAAAGVGLGLAWRWGWVLGVAGAAYLVFQGLYTLFLPILPASHDPVAYQWAEVGRSLVRFVVSLGLILAFGGHDWALLAGVVASTLAVWPLVRGRVAAKLGGLVLVPRWRLPEGEETRATLKRFVAYGWPSILWFFAAQMLDVGDRYVIEAYRGSAELGVYAANYQLAVGLAGIVNAPVALSVFPILMRLMAQSREAEIEVAMRDMSAWYLRGGIALAVCVHFGAEDLLSLALGEAYRSGAGLLLPVFLGQVLWQAAGIGQKGIEAKERTLALVQVVIVAALVNFALNLALVPRFGVAAAAWATLLGQLVYAAGIGLLSRRYIPWRLRWGPLAWDGAMALGGAALASQVTVGPPAVTAAVRAAVFLAVFGLYTWVGHGRRIR